MQIKFKDTSNVFINELVRIASDHFRGHAGEIFRIPSRSEEQLLGLINDDTSSDGDTIEPPQSRPLDLTKAAVERDAYVVRQTNTMSGDMLIAIDGGIANLGEFQGGAVAFAIRGAAVCLSQGAMTILRYNTGALIIDESNKVPVLSYIGRKLGNEELYLARNQEGELVPRPSAFETANQIQDRCRNFVERVIQEECLGILASNNGGLLVLDGAIPAGTFDTPVDYLRELLRYATNNSIDIAAVSKKTSLTFRGKRIADIFEDEHQFVGYLAIKEAIRLEREQLIEAGAAREEVSLANEIYAVRFGLGPPSIAFRVDVNNSLTSSARDVIERLFKSCQIQSCYPKPLIDAHQASSFFYQDIQSLTTDIVARTGAIPKEDQSMEWMFQPFGAFGK